jgi:alkylation response protein AidB-like acyl-CoA dehydrogenase
MAKQPKNFDFGEDELMLRDSAIKFFTDNCSADKIHRLVAPDSDNNRDIECLWDRDLWQQITELGWTAACVPESAGGLGMPTIAAVTLAEQAGKAAFPSPLISTFIATFVLRECQTEAASACLSQIAAGQSATVAITNSLGSWESSDSDVTVSGNTLQGNAYFVQDAQKADFFIVSAKNEKGIGLYRVEASAAGLVIKADGIVDLTRDQAQLTFNNAEATEISLAGGSALENALPAILALVSADMCGAGEWLLQTTVEYTSARIQFDRPLAFFQAVKHPLVNVMIDIDRARSLTFNAACAYDHDPGQAEIAARMAKSAASEMAAFSASRAVQFHGGIGFTWECYVHLFFKRQMHNQMLFGDAKYQRSKLADLLIGKAA